MISTHLLIPIYNIGQGLPICRIPCRLRRKEDNNMYRKATRQLTVKKIVFFTVHPNPNIKLDLSFFLNSGVHGATCCTLQNSMNKLWRDLKKLEL